MRREYNHDDVDKAAWGEGPWLTEPDKVVWVDEATDLDCMIHRNRVGALCGYVGVPPTHPWYGKEYDAIDADVHGGLTYSNKCQETATEEDGICHVPEPGREHDIWWVGFDCAHAYDVAPSYEAKWHDSDRFDSWPKSSYKTVEYVQAECESLAKQAREAA